VQRRRPSQQRGGVGASRAGRASEGRPQTPPPHQRAPECPGAVATLCPQPLRAYPSSAPPGSPWSGADGEACHELRELLGGGGKDARIFPGGRGDSTSCRRPLSSVSTSAGPTPSPGLAESGAATPALPGALVLGLSSCSAASTPAPEGGFHASGNGDAEVCESSPVQEQAPAVQDRKVFVGGVPQDMNQDDLLSVFGVFAEVKKAWVQRNRTDDRTTSIKSGTPQNHRGFGFVIFFDGKSVDVLLGKSNSVFIILRDGRKLEVKRAVSSKDISGGASFGQLQSSTSQSQPRASICVNWPPAGQGAIATAGHPHQRPQQEERSHQQPQQSQGPQPSLPLAAVPAWPGTGPPVRAWPEAPMQSMVMALGPWAGGGGVMPTAAMPGGLPTGYSAVAGVRMACPPGAPMPRATGPLPIPQGHGIQRLQLEGQAQTMLVQVMQNSCMAPSDSQVRPRQEARGQGTSAPPREAPQASRHLGMGKGRGRTGNTNATSTPALTSGAAWTPAQGVVSEHRSGPGAMPEGGRAAMILAERAMMAQESQQPQATESYNRELESVLRQAMPDHYDE